MKIGRQSELQCPRCRVVATRPPGHQKVCTHCGARLVAAPSPSEDWIRAYLYGGGGEGPKVRPVADHEGALR